MCKCTHARKKVKRKARKKDLPFDDVLNVKLSDILLHPYLFLQQEKKNGEGKEELVLRFLRDYSRKICSFACLL